jgi:hypothetical protein
MEYFVKWKGLNYDDCTWELEDVLLEQVEDAEEKINRYKEVNSKVQTLMAGFT